MNLQTKKFITLCATTAFLNSCSLIESNNIAFGYFEAFKTVKGVILGLENKALTPDLINNIPYASMIIKIGKGAPGLVILESIKDAESTWVSADGVYLILKEGKIINTAGLGSNLTDYISPDITFDSYEDGVVKFISYYSYDKPELIYLRVDVELHELNKETITILDKEHDLTQWQEILSNDYLGWQVVNKYWLDESGFVWKSIQNISPKLPPIQIEVTKKPS